MSYFIFNGIDSRDFGVVTKSGFPPIAERTLRTVEIPGRADPLNRLEIMRKNRKITLTVTVTDISRMAEINAWLQGRGDLIFSTDLTKKYRAYVNQAITPTRVHKLCGSVPIVFTVEPFAYSVTNPFVSTPMGMDDSNLTGSMTVISNGTAESCPLLYFSVAGKLRVTVNGTDTPLIITTPGEYSDTEYSYDNSIEEGKAFYHYNYERRNIYIDTAALVAYDGNRNVLTSLTSGPFPTFKTGENVITFELVRETWEHDGLPYISHDMSLGYFGYRKNERWY